MFNNDNNAIFLSASNNNAIFLSGQFLGGVQVLVGDQAAGVWAIIARRGSEYASFQPF